MKYVLYVISYFLKSKGQSEFSVPLKSVHHFGRRGKCTNSRRNGSLFRDAVSDLSRIAINTTWGIFGTIDVAKHMDLPKHNEDFGQTLGYWGVPSGPYFVLPLLGPSSVRDTGGIVGDSLHTNPIFYVDDSATFWTLATTKIIDQRANLIIATETIDETALDPYAFIRDAYLSRRLYLVHDGNPPQDKDEIFDDDDLFKDEGLFNDDELM